MFNQVIFYNHFGAGDIFESREFVKEWMKLVPSNSYHYSHGKNPRILLDIPELQFKEVTEHMNPMRDVWDDNNGNLYVNTWIGRDGRYVLPGIGCTVEQLYKMHNAMLGVYNLGTLSRQPRDYIPKIDYYVYNLLGCADFLYNHPEEKIYIDNGTVQSNQAENFPMDDIIFEIANNHKDKTFLISHSINRAADNIFPTSVITNQPFFDLNEISYLSTFCRVLIGRNSGPHVYSQVYHNVMDTSRRLLSFTYHQQGSSFVVNTDVGIQKIWSPATDFAGVVREIEVAIQ